MFYLGIFNGNFIIEENNIHVFSLELSIVIVTKIAGNLKNEYFAHFLPFCCPYL